MGKDCRSQINYCTLGMKQLSIGTHVILNAGFHPVHGICLKVKYCEGVSRLEYHANALFLGDFLYDIAFCFFVTLIQNRAFVKSGNRQGPPAVYRC